LGFKFPREYTNLLDEEELSNNSSKFLFLVVSGLAETLMGSFNLDLLSLVFGVLKVDFFVTGRWNSKN